jgi:cobalt-zinc-cadmium efflux system protein
MAPARGSAAAAHRGRLTSVLVLSVAILAVEVIGGIAANSLALLADAGHALTDIAGVGMALLAIWFAGRSPTRGRTYGYLRLEVLAAVTKRLSSSSGSPASSCSRRGDGWPSRRKSRRG